VRLRLPTTSRKTDDQVIVESIDSILVDLDPRDEMDLINWWLEIRYDIDKPIRDFDASS
jgi:hypothetical protein